MGRPEFQAWYRDPSRPSGDTLAVAYQNAQGHWRRMCPEFLLFHGDNENMKVSIFDPHGHHLADALSKLRCLAEFAATHGESFHRIESVARMKDGTLRVLDRTDPDIREATTETDDTQARYLGRWASDYYDRAGRRCPAQPPGAPSPRIRCLIYATDPKCHANTRHGA